MSSEPKQIAVISSCAVRRRAWANLLNAVPGIAVSGEWARFQEANAAGAKLEALLVDATPEAQARDGSAEAALSPRESQVLALLAGGCRDKELPARLGVSAGTARTCLRRAMAKTGAGSRTDAVARWLQTDRVRP